MDAASSPAPLPYRKILVLFNPEAGRGQFDKIREGIEAGIEGLTHEVEFVEIGPETNAREITAAARKNGFDGILVAGGDGTVAEAAAGLVGEATPLGIIPTGTANIVATNLAVPSSPREAARAALLGIAAPFDVGRTDDGKIFLLAAGAGYDADLIRDADRELKKRFGPLAYIIAMFKNLRAKRARFTLELDDGVRVHLHAKTVLVCNVGRTMGSLPLAPDARIDDGKLDVVVFRFNDFGQLLVLFVKAIFRQLKGDPAVQFFTSSWVRISASRPMPVQVDGEFIDRKTPIDFTVLPGAVQIMRPATRPALDFAGLAESAMKALKDIPGRRTDEPKPSVPETPAASPPVS